jgi:hypothetical protein
VAALITGVTTLGIGPDSGDNIFHFLTLGLGGALDAAGATPLVGRYGAMTHARNAQVRRREPDITPRNATVRRMSDPDIKPRNPSIRRR